MFNAAAWIGHSEAVSRKHYLTVPEDILDAAAGMSDDPKGTKRGTDCTGMTAHEREPVESATPMALDESTEKQGFYSQKPTGPGGIRTPDLAIMSRRL